MMNGVFRKYGYWIIVAVLAFASRSFAGTTTISLTGVGNGATVWDGAYGGVYVDPYTATVGGVANTPVICDDWSDNSYVGTTWVANVGTLNSSGISGGTPLFGNVGNGGGPLSQQQLYQEVAFLSTLLLENNGNADMQAGISFAIWNLTYPYNTNQELPSPMSFLDGSGDTNALTDFSWAMTQLQNAINTNSLSGAYSFEVLTPQQLGVAQEFLVQAPESSSMILLAADMLGLLALAFLFRKRLLVPIS